MKPALHPNIKLLAWFNFFTDFKLYAPVAIIYFAQVSGSYALGMSIFSLAMLSAALLELPTGIVSDLVGRKKTIILGAFSSLAYALMYAIGGTYAFLVLGAVFEGLSRSFYSGNNNALLYDTLAQTNEEAEYHTFLGKTSSMFQVALAISAIAGSIIAHHSFAWVMWLSVIPQVICIIISLRMIEPAARSTLDSNVLVHTKKAITYFFKNFKLRLLSLASIIGYAFGESTYQFQAAFINLLWPLWAVGISKALSNIGAAISFYLSGRVIKRYSELKVLIIGNIYSRLVNIIALAFPSVLSPAIMSTTSLFFGVSTTAKDNLLQQEFTSAQRATMGSLNSLLGSLAFALVAFALGLFADWFGPIKALLFAQFFLITTVVIYHRLFTRSPAR